MPAHDFLFSHPYCKEIIAAYHQCQKDHPVARFWGKCAEIKYEMDNCTYREVRTSF